MRRDNEKLFTPAEVAEDLGIPISTLYRWRYERKGPPAFRVGRHLRYRESDLEAWLLTCRSPEHGIGEQ